MVGGKVSNRISMPKFSKVVVAYIPNEPPRWNTLTSTIKHIVEVYSENANKYERLGDWAERIGWESFFELTGLEFTHHLIDDFRDPAYYTWRQSTQFKFSELALAAHGGEAHEAASAAEVTAEDKEIVINFLKDKMSRPGAKTKYYFKDFLELFPAKGTRDVKNVLSVLVSEESLEYWSSGSTTMYGLKGAGKQASSERRKLVLTVAGELSSAPFPPVPALLGTGGNIEGKEAIPSLFFSGRRHGPKHSTQARAVRRHHNRILRVQLDDVVLQRFSRHIPWRSHHRGHCPDPQRVILLARGHHLGVPLQPRVHDTAA